MSTSSTSKTVIRGTGITALLTVLSRVLGFVRDLLVARLFGAGAIADAFFVAYRIPNLLRSFVAEGALTSAFVPVLSTELAKDHAKARQAIREVSGLLLLVTLALTILGVVFSDQIVSIFAPGFQSEPLKGSLCADLTAIMFPYIIFVSLIALVNGALNTVHIYGASGIAQVVMNIVLILGALLAARYADYTAAIVLAISVLVGGLAQIIAQIPALRKAGFSIWPSRKVFSPVTKEVLKLMLPATIGAGIYQTGIFLNTLLASFLSNGSVSWLFYADRVTQLPIGIFTIALASVLLPVLSKARAGKNEAEFAQSLVNSLRYTSFVIIPVVTFLYVFAEPIVTLLFERGAFSHMDAVRTAIAVQALLLGVWAVSCHSMVTRAFIARKDTLTPTMLGALMLVMNVLLSLNLMGPVVSPGMSALDEFVTSMQRICTISWLAATLGHVGLALASSLSSTVVFLILGFVALRRLRHLDPRPFIHATFRAVASAAAMTLMVTQLPVSSGGGVFEGIISLVLVSVVGAASYIAASFALRSPEAQETFSVIYRLVSRRQ